MFITTPDDRTLHFVIAKRPFTNIAKTNKLRWTLNLFIYTTLHLQHIHTHFFHHQSNFVAFLLNPLG
jgi:hypothetical protein